MKPGMLGMHHTHQSSWCGHLLKLVSRSTDYLMIKFSRFLNKGLSDFNLALDLGFLTKARKYTFFKPKFIFYATYLSEKIGYWRYITIYRHLKANPEYQCYPIFNYFENWCQDENRHGDFFSALMKAQPQFLNDWKAKLWARFFCLSVILYYFPWFDAFSDPVNYGVFTSNLGLRNWVLVSFPHFLGSILQFSKKKKTHKEIEPQLITFPLFDPPLIA